MNVKLNFAGTVKITEDTLDGARVAALLEEHLSGMADHSPPESIHALALDQLKSPDITFWTVWHGEDLLGCGALRELNPLHGEIKSMRTARPFLGMGVATALLQHIITVSKTRGYQRLSLETGSGTAFQPAHALYLKFGFDFCGRFGDYPHDPFSRYMSLGIGKNEPD